VFPSPVDHAVAFIKEAWRSGVCDLYGKWDLGLPLERLSHSDVDDSAFGATFGPLVQQPYELSVRSSDLPAILAHYER